jgi:decaprenylphospho-beta-D-ribofuranose 2-oxidase
VIELPAFNRIELDPASGTVTAGAGVTQDQILRVIGAAGFFLRVDACHSQRHGGRGHCRRDVHGKNHHVEGSFDNHVQALLLVDGKGSLRQLRPVGGGAPLFWATIGGMGLTSVIVEATRSR